MGYALLALILVQALGLGISDDEAYYWALSQRPGLGFSYHPGGVVWAIWLSEKVLGFLPYREWIVRLPFVAMIGLLLWELRAMSKTRSAFTLALTAGGIWAASWLAVPDPMLMLGVVLSLRGVIEERPIRLATGLALALFAKFSGILLVASAMLVTFRKPRLFKAVLIGSLVGLLPAVAWNLTSDFQPLRYQLFQRHQGSGVSLLRGVQFWVAQALLVGPLFFVALWRACRDSWRTPEKIFLLPALVIFGVQPFLSAYKIHWGLPFWLAAMVWWVRRAPPVAPVLRKAQVAIGFSVLALLTVVFRVPILTQALGTPLMDPGADLRGWRRLPAFVQSKLGTEALQWPVVGSRYQTAAQAAFHWARPERVTLYPKSGTENLEWPDLSPQRFLFVADERYREGPTVPWARCQSLGRFDEPVGGVRGKWIEVWDCLPIGQTLNQVIADPHKTR